MKNIIFTICILFPLISCSQYSFEFRLENLNDKVPGCAIERENGNYLIAGGSKGTTDDYSNLQFVELSPQGELLRNIRMEHDSFSYSPFHLSYMGDTLQVLGRVFHLEQDYLWRAIFDEDLSMIEETIYFDGPTKVVRITDVKEISDDRFILIGFSDYSVFDGFAAIIDKDGSLLKHEIYGLNEGYIPSSVIEYADNSGFLMKGFNNVLVFLNTELEITGTSILGNIGEAYDMENTMRRLDDSTYLMSSTHRIQGTNTGSRNISLSKIQHIEEVLEESKIGEDTLQETTAFGNSLDFVERDKIYCGGWVERPPTATFNYHHFIADKPGWFILSQYDEGLNLNWTRWYGGDAYYAMYSLMATQDGGCLMLGGRNEFSGPAKRDIYILKVGPNGLLTSTTTPENTINITVYPNPTSNYIFFDIGETGMYDISFFDGLGKVIFQGKTPNNRPVDVRHLPAGAYVYVLEREGEIISQGKWVKE